jgi:pyruvate dehydrogenase phosphatase
VRPCIFLARAERPPVGHAGTATSDYTARKLPGRIYAKLAKFSATFGRLTRETVGNGARVSALLTDEVEAFDRHIGKTLHRLCPRPAALTRADADALIAAHADVLQRANHGTTVAAALVNLDERLMWAVGVGDSTIGAWCRRCFLLCIHATG